MQFCTTFFLSHSKWVVSGSTSESTLKASSFDAVFEEAVVRKPHCMTSNEKKACMLAGLLRLDAIK